MATYNQSQMTLPSGDVVKFVDNVSGYTTNTGTITKVQANGTDVASSGTANIPAASTSSYGVTKLSNATDSSSEVLAATPKAVKTVMDAVTGLGSPMTFKGTLGTGGTITDVPAASASTKGYTYKVITAGTYASIAAKVGDVFVCNDTPEWVLIPSGDEPSGTVTSVKIQATSPIAIDSDAAITSSGTRTLSHANSGATAGSYGDSAAQTPGYGSTFKVPYVTVDAKGHVTAISDHTVKIPASDNTNTTYTFANGTNGFTVTPSGGSAQTVTVTPSITNNVTGSGTSGYIAKFNGANTITNGPAFGSGTTFLRNDGTWQTPTNTTNTAGSTDTSSKIFLVGATSQAASPQTYSDNQVYATNGQLDANKVRVAENVTLQYNSTTKSLDFIFA